MARRARKSAAQQVVGLATDVLPVPSPLKRALASKYGAPIVLAIAGAALATGVVSLQWTDGKPNVVIDKERAKQVEEKVVDRIRKRTGEKAPATTSSSFPPAPALDSNASGLQSFDSTPSAGGWLPNNSEQQRLGRLNAPPPARR